MSAVPYDLVGLVHIVLAEHYRQYHRDDDHDHAEAFAETFLEKLFGLAVQADANQAVAALDIRELPWFSPGADENYRLAGILREALCQEIQRWLLHSGTWRYNVGLKASAYARVVACAANVGVYASALHNAERGGYRSALADDGLPEAERQAMLAEQRYQAERRRW